MKKTWLTAICVLVLGHNYCWGDDVPFKDIPRLTLTGQAMLHKPADELCLTVGVVTLAIDAETALKNNNANMQAVTASLKKVGLGDDEYETGHFNIRPTYTPTPKNPPQDWKPSINGYEVSNSVNIKTSQMKLAGTIIDAASKSGANSIDNIRFQLKDANIHRDEAIAAAAAVAIKEAETLAKATGQKLMRLLLVTLDEAAGVAPMPRAAPMMFRAASYSGEPTPILPGSVDVSASVTVVYEIAKE